MTFEECLAKSEEQHRIAAGGGRGAAGDIGIMLGIDIAMHALKMYHEDPPDWHGEATFVIDTVYSYKPKVVTP